jgi:hypothetical protein
MCKISIVLETKKTMLERFCLHICLYMQLLQISRLSDALTYTYYSWLKHILIPGRKYCQGPNWYSILCETS